jgi:hypothetical protein
MNIIIFTILTLVLVHYLCDYPLQGDFIARAKNRFQPVQHVPWYHPMIAHTFMHGFGVYLVLGVWWIGVLEMISHFAIDYQKCRGELTFSQDQALHIGCKVLWVALALFVV